MEEPPIGTMVDRELTGKGSLQQYEQPKVKWNINDARSLLSVSPILAQDYAAYDIPHNQI
jgi:hypothetical protein